MSEEEFKEWYEGEKEYYEELKDEAKQLHDYAVSYDDEIAYQKQKRWQKRLDILSLVITTLNNLFILQKLQGPENLAQKTLISLT